MLRSWFVAVLGLTLTCTSASLSARSVSSCDVIRTTGNPDYPPALWTSPDDPNRLMGVAVELLQLALEPKGIKVTSINVGTWGRAQVQARTGAIDMLTGAFITDERLTYMDYIQPPFMVMPSVIWVRKNSGFHFKTWDDLKGKQGVTLINNSFGQEFDAFSATHLDVSGVRSAEQIFKLVSAGRMDYGIYELYQAKAMDEATGVLEGVQHLKPAISSEGLYFTISKNSPCRDAKLKSYLDTRIQQLIDEKVPDRLTEKYLSIWREQHPR